MTATAWAGDVNLTEDTEEGTGTAAHWYVNMPATGTNTLTLADATITSFKVYDDKGKNNNPSNQCRGTLTLTAPTGYVLQLSGKICTSRDNDDLLTVYDGSDKSAPKLLNEVKSTSNGVETVIQTVNSSGQSMTIYFSTGWPFYYGLDLTVTLISTSTNFGIICASAAGGTMTANPTSATVNQTVTLTASPESGYLLKGINVVDNNSYPVAVDWSLWDNTATFAMPARNVTVTPVFTNDMTDFSVNMPTTGTKTLTIPSGVQSFKVYDDGGESGNNSKNSNGTLTLTAPENYVLQISGKIWTEMSDKLTVYDGNGNTATKLLDGVSSTSDGGEKVIQTVNSSGQSMTINFTTNNWSYYDGLDLTVTLISTSTGHSITCVPAENGTMTASINDVDITSATVNQTVTLKATPASGYVLGGISVVDDNNNPVAVDWILWANTATFTMPARNVTVTPLFTNDLTGFSVNMPTTDTKTITIPSGVQSFKVYDNGGESANYSNNCSGTLTLTAPEGCTLLLSGKIWAETIDKLTVYDGNDNKATTLLNRVTSTNSGAETPITTVESTGQSMTLYFYSDNSSSYAGLDLTVTVYDTTTEYNINGIGEATNGSITASVGSTNVSTAKYNDVVTLTATPASGYVMETLSVKDVDNNDVAVTWDGPLSNTATFTMPRCAVTVTSTFSNTWKPEVTVTSETTAWKDGYTYIVASDVTIDSRISVSGTVKLEINEGATLTASQGINVPESATLTINETGTGTLTATNPTSDKNYAAIGGDAVSSCGTINICGGTINATSKSSGAAIGTGSYGTGGVVNISGGTITASNTSNGAAIGDGYTNNSTSISSITISGGTINATATKGSNYGSAHAAAIGGCYNSNGGAITISGGKITANGEYKGIGAGSNCTETAATTITIGLTNAEDYIDINSYNCGKVVVASTSQSLKQQADGGNVYAAGTEITDLTAINGQKLMVYEGEKHTITFDSNGGSTVASQQVTDGGTATQPENPVKAGYSFTGWTLNSSAYDFSTAVTGDITLTAAWAAVPAIDYIGSTGSTVNTSSYAPVYEGMTKMNATDAAVWVVGSDMTISNRITVNGDVSLVLTNGATLRATKGFTVQGSNSLTIYGQTNGTGKLYAGTTSFSDQTADENYAAIGGEKNNAGGTFTIYGGMVYAVGGKTAAAIGGGYYGAGGTINIHGGTVKAIGGSNAASIGGGLNAAGGNITIDGGSVDVNSASRSSFGAGIGGGRLGGAGTIIISGGTVTADATEGAAIGNGESSREGDQGSITISGGTVQAESNSTGCAGIGAGLTAKCPTITISGGTVNTGWKCIGEDSRNNYIRSEGSTITISGGNITAEHIGIQGNSPTTGNMTISLSWTNETDQITVKGFSGNLVTATPNLYKISETSNIATNDVLSAISSQTTLVPLTAITLANDASNSDILTTTNGVTGLNVTLADRTLVKDGNWNTLCLPFDVTLSGSVLDGATVKELDATNSNLGSDGMLTLTFKDATSIDAGKPYLVKWTTGENISNPVFNGVTITATAPTAVEFANNANASGNCQFVGQFSPFTIDDSNQDEIILLGAGNTLGYSQATRTLRSFRAHFMVPTDGGAALVRGFVLDFGEGQTTSITEMRNEELEMRNVFNLNGQRVSQPSRGLYIVNGKKVLLP